MTDRPNIKNLTVEELAIELDRMGFERYRLDQVVSWLYNKGIAGWGAMTNLGKDKRALLDERFEFGLLEPARVQESVDGTRKYLFELPDGGRVESVFIPEDRRRTLCISTQVGCALGCRFCHTATLGFKRNLEPWEIVEQVLAVRRDLPPETPPTNIVFMGMGEPLMNYENVLKISKILTRDNGLNFSSRHVTLSTAGLPRMIEKLGADKAPLNIAISLNAADNELRSRIMPVNERYPLDDVLAALETFPLPNRRRITFEYIMFDGVNDSDLDARKLANKIKRFPNKVNVIPFNSFPGCEFRPSPPERIEAFMETLRDKHISVFLRKSRGADILAACGQLAGGKSE